MTGLYPHTNGCTENNVPLKPETPCLPQMIASGEYVTAHYGKWHLGDELYAQHGFQEWIGIEDGYNRYFSEGRDRNIRSAYHHCLVENG
jgi:arylsulfatase A-like enzyme